MGLGSSVKETINSQKVARYQVPGWGRVSRHARKLLQLVCLFAILANAQFVAAEPKATQQAPLASSIKQALLSVFEGSPSVNPTAPESALESEQTFAMQLGSLQYLDETSSPLNTEQFASKRVVVYFWSIYCRGCIAPARELQQMREALRESDIEVVTVHLFESDRARIISRLAQLSLGLPVLFGPNEIRDLFSVKVLPTTLVFDDSHRMVARFDGGFDKESLSLTVRREQIAGQ